jgi:RNA polymerase sigma factor (sigma-70 family)
MGRLRVRTTPGCNILGRSNDWRDVGDVSSKPQPMEAVYRSSWLALTRLAYLLVGDRSEAEDIVQSVFTTAVTRWEVIDEPAAYLRRAVVNRANDAHRRTFRRAAVAVGAPGSIDEPEVDEMWRLVRALPAPQRAAVVLRFYEDLALADIASLLGRPASTVRSDLRRALTTLKRLMV